MATLKEQVEAVVADLILNEARLDVWVNGADDADYTPEGGGSVPSIRKFIAETFKFQGAYSAGGTDYAIGQTFKGASGADAYKMFRVTANFTSTNLAGDAGSHEVIFDFSNVVADAETAQGAAEDAQTAAEAAQAAVEAVFDSFDDRYLGAKSSDPALDNDGNALTDGAIYWNTTINRLKFYDLGNTVWVDPAQQASSFANDASASADDASDSASAAATSAANAANATAGKEFGSGVAFDGVDGKAQGVYFDPKDHDFSFCLLCTTNPAGSSQATIIQNGLGGSSGVFASLTTSTGSTIGIRVDDNITDVTANATGLSPNTLYPVACVKDGDTLRTYINGTQAGTANVSALGSLTSPSPEQWIGAANTAGAGAYKGVIKDFAIFNRALSATEAAEIAVNGISAFLASNSHNQWSGGNVIFNNASLTAGQIGFDWTYARGNNGASITSDTVNSITGVSIPTAAGATLSQLVDASVDSDFNRNIVNVSEGRGFTVTMTVSNFSGTGQGAFGLNFAPRDSAKSNFIFSGNGTYTFQIFEEPGMGSPNSARTLFYAVGGSANFDISNFSAVRTGAVTHLPMNEGIGCQLHDRSPNHNDALLSATGFQHLQPKREGFIRDFNIDAYNGGSGNVELISSSRDILPANAILYPARIKNNAAGTIGTGLLDLRRSDRTNRNTIGDNTVDIATTQGGILSTDDAAQILDDYNVALDGSGDSDATDIDVVVPYKRID